MARIHRVAPDAARDILTEAVRADAAAPVAVHVRSEMHALLARQLEAEATSRPEEDLDGRWAGIDLVIDDSIPAMPGYEIHRAIGARSPAVDHPRAA